MEFLWLILTLCPDVLTNGPPTEIVLCDDPGLLITNCRVHTQRVYVRLDAENVYRQHITPVAHLSWAGADWTTQAVKHAQLDTVHILTQHQKFTVTQSELAEPRREKLFNIYRLKTVLNIGFWRDSTHVKITTPPIVAYQEHNPDFYLTPNLLMCTLTKDVHYLCPSKPFVRDNTERLCGLKPIASEERCRAKLTARDGVTTTQVEVVPEGEIIHIDDLALYQLPDDRIGTDIEMHNASAKRSLELPQTIQNQIQYERPMTVDLSVLNEALLVDPTDYKPKDWSVTRSWTVPDSILSVTMILGLIALGILKRHQMVHPQHPQPLLQSPL
ncbi:unnamed protein product, partial [Coregonus sp. 'balchen']